MPAKRPHEGNDEGPEKRPRLQQASGGSLGGILRVPSLLGRVQQQGPPPSIHSFTSTYDVGSAVNAAKAPAKSPFEEMEDSDEDASPAALTAGPSHQERRAVSGHSVPKQMKKQVSSGSVTSLDSSESSTKRSTTFGEKPALPKGSTTFSSAVGLKNVEQPGMPLQRSSKLDIAGLPTYPTPLQDLIATFQARNKDSTKPASSQADVRHLPADKSLPKLGSAKTSNATSPASSPKSSAQPSQQAPPVENISKAAEDLRKRRIEKKQERNRRNREEDAKAGLSQSAVEDEVFDLSLPSPLAQPVTTGLDGSKKVSNDTIPGQAPFSLNSPAGVAAVSTSRKAEASRRRLGRITADDLRLVSLRNDRLVWSRIADLHRQHTGVSRSGETLSRRHRLVDAALKRARINENLQQAVLRLVPGAEDKLNNLVALAGGEQKDASTSGIKEQGDDYPERVLASNIVANSYVSTLANNTTQQISTDEQGKNDRPTVGGKKPSWALMQSLFTNNDEDEEEDQKSEASQKSQDPEGYNHFEYQVQRRECSAVRSADGSSIDEMVWHDMNEPFTSLEEANATASGLALLARVGVNPIVDPQVPFSTKHNTDADGGVLCEYESELGIVQTRIAQRVRAYLEHIPAQSKKGWVPRTLYHVKQRITKRSVDDLWEEAAVSEVRETFVDECTSADLAWANNKAIAKFVELTHEAKSANLNLRDVEIAQAKQQLHDELYRGGDNVLLYQSKETSQGLIEIFVEKGKLMGPRNF